MVENTAQLNDSLTLAVGDLEEASGL